MPSSVHCLSTNPVAQRQSTRRIKLDARSTKSEDILHDTTLLMIYMFQYHPSAFTSASTSDSAQPRAYTYTLTEQCQSLLLLFAIRSTLVHKNSLDKSLIRSPLLGQQLGHAGLDKRRRLKPDIQRHCLLVGTITRITRISSLGTNCPVNDLLSQNVLPRAPQHLGHVRNDRFVR